MLCCTPFYRTPLQRFIDFYPTLFPYLCALIFLAMVSTLAIKGSKRLLVVKIISLLVMTFIALAISDVLFFKDIASLIGAAINTIVGSDLLDFVLFMFLNALFVFPIILMPFMPFLVVSFCKPQGRYQMIGVQVVQYLTATFTALTVIFLLLTLR